MTYQHKVQYYETDRMGITHHSNYIRFMEEARTEWMESMGMGYDEFESLGLTSPSTFRIAPISRSASPTS